MTATDSTVNSRFVLCIEKQRCLWDSPKNIPEVDIKFATVLGYYGAEEPAIDALKTYLSHLGTTPTWADVRPIEECAICRKDFNTVDWHMAVVLSQEAGTKECPEVLDVKYAARLRTNCEPCDHGNTAA